MFPAKKKKTFASFRKFSAMTPKKRPKHFLIIYIIYDVADILKYCAYVLVFMTSVFQSNKLKDVVSHNILK